MCRHRASQINPADIARFDGDLVSEITEAYLADHGLPASARNQVLAMVDSVL
jgi:hypothetical protein